MDCNLRKNIEISGYASTFNHIDKQNDVIVKGAFQKCINEFTSVPLLFQHNSSQILGIVKKISEDSIGLFIEATIISTSLGINTASLISNKALNHFSIGFQIVACDSYDVSQFNNKFNVRNKCNLHPGAKIRVIKEIRLIEISAVTFPANVQAKIYTIGG
ncbi:MAG: HK97 family phage prohead protease [Pseudomonadota bacterium]